MSVASTKGQILMTVQKAGKVGEGNTFTPSGESWYLLPVINSNAGEVTGEEVAPLEIGRIATPNGAFRTMEFGAGNFTFAPRLERSIGYFLFGMMGETFTEVNTPVVGAHKHTFRYNEVNFDEQPYMAFRVLTPGQEFTDSMGDTIYDCKIGAVSLSVPPMGKLAAQVSFQGRDVIFSDGTDWVAADIIEDYTTVPESGAGYAKFSNVQYELLGMDITFANQLTTPQQEMSVGSYRPRGFTRLAGGVSIRTVLRFKDSELIRQIQTGAINGTTWTNVPFIQKTVGSVDAFEARFEAPNYVTGNTPYSLTFRANQMVWRVDGPPRLQAGGFVVFSLTGTVLTPDDSDAPYCHIEVVNGISTPYSQIMTGGTPPVVTAASTPTDVTVPETATIVDATLTVTDSDSTDFENGYARFELGGAQVNDGDVLEIVTESQGAGNVILVGNSIYIGADAVAANNILVGAFQPAVGATKDLVIKFTSADATPNNVQLVLRRIGFRRTQPGTGIVSTTITIKGIVEDGDYGLARFDMPDLALSYTI